MWRPFNVLIRDVTCRTISTDDGNLNCCFVSQRGRNDGGLSWEEGREGERVPQRDWCAAYMHKYVRERYVSGVWHFVRAFHATCVTGRFGKIRGGGATNSSFESARFFRSLRSRARFGTKRWLTISWHDPMNFFGFWKGKREGRRFY